MEEINDYVASGELRAMVLNGEAHEFTMNLMRAFELRRAWEIAGVVELIDDVDLMVVLAEHAAAEARHSHLLTQRLLELGGRPSRIPPDDDYVGRLRARGLGLHIPALRMAQSTLDHRALVPFVVDLIDQERRYCAWLRAYAAVSEVDPSTQAVIREILRDEEAHAAVHESMLARFRAEGLGAEIDAHEHLVRAIAAEVHDADYAPKVSSVVRALLASDPKDEPETTASRRATAGA